MKRPLLIALGASVLSFTGQAIAQDRIAVTVENLAPAMGTFQTPVWIGVHNGSFNLYDRGLPAAGPNAAITSDALERLAEDGITGGLAQAFSTSGSGLVETTIPGPNGPIAPGDRAFSSLLISPTAASSRYLSYASMVLPSNDAFIAGGNPTGHPLYNASGDFVFRDFFSSTVLDAGTEVNDEVPANTAFLAQAAPNTGVTENGVIRPHAGFMAPGNGGILDLFRFRNGQFAQSGYPHVMVRVRRATAITEDRTYLTLAVGANEVPSVDTPASVRAAFMLNSNGTNLNVRMVRQNLSNVVAMHLHMGPAGQNGPVVLALAGPFAPGGGPAPTGVTNMSFGGADLTGPLADYPLDALIAAMEAGNVYLNVHTNDGDVTTMGLPGDNPSGEVRGQLIRE